MFPRLQVKDADKGGGPRPPPRNKMALYEQLSVPSKRFNHAAAASIARCSSLSADKLLILPQKKNTDGNLGNLDGASEDAENRGQDGAGNAEKHDEGMSENSILDSDLPGFNISPDDVVRAIGPKYFWKARRAIVNQQRVFALQVFELHRLIKVQKIIAGSPSLCLNKKKKNSNGNDSSKLQLHSLKKKVNGDGIQRILPRPPQEEDGCNKNTPTPPPPPAYIQPFPNGCYPGNLSMMPMMTSGPTGNQWLIPVMSPTEGLIYKPYMSPCLPPSTNTAAGFIPPPPPVGYVPHPLPIAGDFMNPAYRINPTAVCPPGFFTTPYGLVPIMNNTNEVINRPTTSNINTSNSCSSIKGKKNKRSKNSNNEAHNLSSTSSTSEKTPPPESEERSGNGLLSFKSMASTVEEDTEHTRSSTHHSDRQQAQVIKVVPHNKRSATESAARIFQSIQEERQLYE
ncbi:hypothetical protein ZOSMA_3G01990 [Zostera marina]|uniref:Protein EARLY FLOWERING 3 n=1 Tax=Zostera marina TaxID=29655 RepID=A0A0K9P407_ZOSMR|nr:hypothetical protein ZOSMA_3G01990 [Zostera marina]